MIWGFLVFIVVPVVVGLLVVCLVELPVTYRKADLWQVPLAVVTIPLWAPLLLLGLLVLAVAEVWASLRGHETDPTLACGCLRCMRKKGVAPSGSE